MSSLMKYSMKDENVAGIGELLLSRAVYLCSVKTNTGLHRCLIFNQEGTRSVTKINSIYGWSEFPLIKMTG